jgi:hypothetical protein
MFLKLSRDFFGWQFRYIPARSSLREFLFSSGYPEAILVCFWCVMASGSSEQIPYGKGQSDFSDRAGILPGSGSSRWMLVPGGRQSFLLPMARYVQCWSGLVTPALSCDWDFLSPALKRVPSVL